MKLLEKRLRLAKGLEKLRKQNPKLLSPEKIKELAKRFPNIDLNDPKVRGQLEHLLRQQNPKFENLTPEQIEALQKLLKEAFPEPGKVPVREAPPKSESNPELPNNPMEGKTEPNSPKEPSEPISPEEQKRQAEAQTEAARQLTNLARGLERVAGNLNESPTLKQTFQDLGAMALRHAGERPNGNASELNAQLAQFNRWSGQGNGWFQKNWPHLRAMDLPRFSAPRLPAVSVPWRPPMPSGIGVGGPSTDTLKFVMVAALVASLVVVVGIMLDRLSKRRQAAGDDWQLGPWPISPAAVRTRADLIRTFEYLSLLRLGRQARTWNHRAISRSLAGEQTPERLAAAKLAELYEQARYAPADEPLSAEEMETYRHDLCLLAGVAAS